MKKFQKMVNYALGTKVLFKCYKILPQLCGASTAPYHSNETCSKPVYCGTLTVPCYSNETYL
jgi:hypothetical protein